MDGHRPIAIRTRREFYIVGISKLVGCEIEGTRGNALEFRLKRTTIGRHKLIDVPGVIALPRFIWRKQVEVPIEDELAPGVELQEDPWHGAPKTGLNLLPARTLQSRSVKCAFSGGLRC
jgi:hypothetical protein